MRTGQVKLRPVFLGLIMFITVFSLYNFVHTDINGRYGVQNNHTVSVQDEMEQVQNTIKSDDEDDKGLLEKIRTLSDPLEDPFATIGAGLFVVPQLLSLLTTPIDIVDGMMGDLQGTLNQVPPEVWGPIMLVFAAVIVFGIVELLLRVNEA